MYRRTNRRVVGRRIREAARLIREATDMLENKGFVKDAGFPIRREKVEALQDSLKAYTEKEERIHNSFWQFQVKAFREQWGKDMDDPDYTEEYFSLIHDERISVTPSVLIDGVKCLFTWSKPFIMTKPSGVTLPGAKADVTAVFRIKRKGVEEEVKVRVGHIIEKITEEGRFSREFVPRSWDAIQTSDYEITPES